MQNELLEKLNAEINRLRDSNRGLVELYLDAERAVFDWRAAYFTLLAKTKEGAEE